MRTLIAARVVPLLAALALAIPAAAQSVPGPPIGLSSAVAGDSVSLAWISTSGSPTTHVIEAGSAPGLADLASVATGSATPAFVAAPVPPGHYYVRVRARNAAGTSGPSNEVIVTVGTPCQLPPAPLNLTSTVVGTSVTLEWQGTGGSFWLEAGSGPGRTDAFNGHVGTAPTTTASAAVGAYFVRVRERNGCGFGPPSDEIIVSVGVSAPPTNLRASIISAAVTFRWDGPGANPAPAGYLLEAGSSPGLADVAVLPLAGSAVSYAAAGVPPGTYFVRLRAVSAPAASAPSNELTVTVGPAPPLTSTVTFTDLAPVGAPFVSHSEAGYLVENQSGPWVNGSRITFTRPSGDPLTTGEVRVTRGGSEFRFTSVDLYSSTTPIPYVFTGTRGGATVFTLAGTVPNTFGNVATVPNPNPLAWIDTLVIAVSNPPGLSNPVGLDNIVLRP